MPDEYRVTIRLALDLYAQPNRVKSLHYFSYSPGKPLYLFTMADRLDRKSANTTM